MKKYLFLLLCFSLSFSAFSQEVPADSVSADGKTSFHGERISEDGALSLEKVPMLVAEGQELASLKLSGEVDACCQAKGCWMSMTLPDGKSMRVTFKDYGFFVPINSAGSEAIIEGKAFVETTSVDILRHYAVDGGMSQEEAEKTITEPEVNIAFEATGVIIKSE